ncbi:MAG: class I SAM-dependent methyltransferase [Acidobacteria bacterium]|nr:class I SAM-dependent methyltransferase [Acidobacteriota bacterium]
MPGESTVRTITGLLRKGVRREGLPFAAASAHGREADAPFHTKAFRKFLSAVAARESPVLVDLGPVVGSNVSYIGERLGCKIFVEDLYADLEGHVRQGRAAAFGEFLKGRLTQADGSVDGILCWDFFDYLDRQAAAALARELTRLLAPGGALLGFFATVGQPRPFYTKYAIVNDREMRPRPYAATRGRQPVWLNRDIIRMFDRLLVSDSFLLQVSIREILFRKPSTTTAARPGA